MNNLMVWAARWGIPAAAIADLQQSLLGLDTQPSGVPGRSEAAVQSRVRVAASQAGRRVWRNNVGAVHDPVTNMHVRFGLANDSPQVNKALKSGDLIGITPRLIGPADLGSVVGQFTSYECKHGGWRFTGSDRENAQAAWAALVTSLGGIARFVTDEGQIL